MNSKNLDKNMVFLAKKHLYLAKQANYSIPIYDNAGVICGIQEVQEDRNKKVYGTLKGGFHILYGSDEALLVCEGFSTGVALNSVLGIRTLVTFSDGNMLPAVKSYLLNHKVVNLIFCADNDKWKPWAGNTGVKAANKCVKEFGGKVVAPEFPSFLNLLRPTDFDDLKKYCGDEVLKNYFKDILK